MEPNKKIGWFKFTMNRDNKSFKGEWGYLGRGKRGDWNGTRDGDGGYGGDDGNGIIVAKNLRGTRLTSTLKSFLR